MGDAFIRVGHVPVKSSSARGSEEAHRVNSWRFLLSIHPLCLATEREARAHQKKKKKIIIKGRRFNHGDI